MNIRVCLFFLLRNGTRLGPRSLTINFILGLREIHTKSLKNLQFAFFTLF